MKKVTVSVTLSKDDDNDEACRFVQILAATPFKTGAALLCKQLPLRFEVWAFRAFGLGVVALGRFDFGVMFGRYFLI